ncbi:MAG: hypothetical protein AAF670_10340 [Planctomycetota bacterium]
MHRALLTISLLILVMAGVATFGNPSSDSESSIELRQTPQPEIIEPSLQIDIISEADVSLDAIEPVPVAPPAAAGVPYELNQVRGWAAAYSPDAALLESESRAIMYNVDPKDEESCCSAQLIRAVLCELALGRRFDDAASAAKAYHRWIAALEGAQIASEATTIHADLVALASKAEELEIEDGNLLELRQQSIQLNEGTISQSFAISKLRQELSRVTGREEAEAAIAFPVGSLPTTAVPIDASLVVSIALHQRHDLLAVNELCRRMNQCNLPAARQLLGAVSPGVGLSLTSSCRGGLFNCLKDDSSDDDLAARRRQCRQLHRSLSRTVRNEVLQAVLDVRAAQAQVDLAEQQIAIARLRLSDAQAELQLDQVIPGTDTKLRLELLQLRGERVERQMKLAVALDELARVKNDPIPGSPY